MVFRIHTAEDIIVKPECVIELMNHEVYSKCKLIRVCSGNKLKKTNCDHNDVALLIMRIKG